VIPIATFTPDTSGADTLLVYDADPTAGVRTEMLVLTGSLPTAANLIGISGSEPPTGTDFVFLTDDRVLTFTGTPGTVLMTVDEEGIATFKLGDTTAALQPDLDEVTKITVPEGWVLETNVSALDGLWVDGAGSVTLTGEVDRDIFLGNVFTDISFAEDTLTFTADGGVVLANAASVSGDTLNIVGTGNDIYESLLLEGTDDDDTIDLSHFTTSSDAQVIVTGGAGVDTITLSLAASEVINYVRYVDGGQAAVAIPSVASIRLSILRETPSSITCCCKARILAARTSISRAMPTNRRSMLPAATRSTWER